MNGMLMHFTWHISWHSSFQNSWESQSLEVLKNYFCIIFEQKSIIFFYDKRIQ